jgi:hypothetical protein
MNKALLEKVLPHLHVQTVVPTRMVATVAPWFDRRLAFASFTRVNWASSEVAIAEVAYPVNGEQHLFNLLKVLVTTRTWVVRVGEGGIPEDSVELNNDDVVFDLQVDFAVEYVVAGCKPDELPQDALSEFVSHNMPYHLWPYYRQTVQDLALRFQVPIPDIPSFRVPKTHRPEN